MKISKVLSLCLLGSTCLITACSGNARASINHLVSGAQRDGFLALIYKKKPIKFKSSFTEQYQKSDYYDYENNLINKSFKLEFYSFEEIKKAKKAFEPHLIFKEYENGFSDYDISISDPYYGRIESETIYTYDLATQTINVSQSYIDLSLTKNSAEYKIVNEENHPYKIDGETKELLSEMYFDDYLKSLVIGMKNLIDFMLDTTFSGTYYSCKKIEYWKRVKNSEKFSGGSASEENAFYVSFQKNALRTLYYAKNVTQTKHSIGKCRYDCIKGTLLEYLD